MNNNHHETSIYPPGTRIGILGSGQLGQMMAIAAKKLGYHVVIYDATDHGPATAYADLSITAPFDDTEALFRFIHSVDLITLEFENIPATTLEKLASQRPLFPSPAVVRICQDRVLEKEFLRSHGFPVAPFSVITSADELSKALRHLPPASSVGKNRGEALLKTAMLGYDGKGQLLLHSEDDALIAWSTLKTTRAVLEQKISFIGEASVICARSSCGEISCFPLQENIHRKGILNLTIAPARFGKEVAKKAESMACAITEALGVVGLLAIEFFVLPNESLIVNELAPRPHNSGHHTMDSSKTSQFEQIIRAICNLSLGSPELQQPAVMVNLLGDLWNNGEPDWSALTNNPNTALHLYGKKEAKPGRKMGHVTLFGHHQEALIKHAQSLLGDLEGKNLGVETRAV